MVLLGFTTLVLIVPTFQFVRAKKKALSLEEGP